MKTQILKLYLTVGIAIPVGMMAKTQHPNVVFILADDLGYGDISALNEHSKIRTTQIDRLCENGVAFTDTHSGSSVSTPSRYGILTGRYAFRTRLKKGTLVGYSEPLIDADRSTIATMLSKQGYSTACIGKWHLGWHWARKENSEEVDFSRPITDGPISRGFDYFFGIAASLDMPPYVYVENNQPTAIPDRIATERKGIELFRSGPQAPDFEPEDCLPEFTQKAIQYIDSRKGEENPFFLYLPITAPHTPILPSATFRGRSGLSPYGDFVLMVDNMVGQIVEVLKKNGIYDNTIIIFTSDNGCFHGAGMQEMQQKGHDPSYIYRGSKSDIFDGGHRIPLIVSWNKHFKKKTENAIISLNDFYATFAQMTGYKLKNNEGEDSFSMWPLLLGTGKSERNEVIHHSNEGNFAIRKGEWKLIFCPGSGGWSYPSLPRDSAIINRLPALQLYNMSEDVVEKVNRIDQYKDIVMELTDKMQEIILNGRSTPGEK